MNRYLARGVSAKKEDVHFATSLVDPGIYPSAFCKIVPDYLGDDLEYCNIMHADGAGTKASLAYLYYQETGTLSVFEGIAQDAIVMNVDDLLCVGAYQNILFSSTIGRNSRYISGDVIKTIIEANEKLAQDYAQWGINLQTTGGETADVGDLVRTLIVDSSVMVRLAKSKLILNDQIQPGNIIVGLASDGQTTYETTYNSGIGSNGLTSARHDLLHQDYAHRYPESYEPTLPSDLVYSGPFHLEDALEGTPLTIGEALLSPTRTYAPMIKTLLENHQDLISGIIHCSGGGQTKCLKFGQGIHYIKNNFFPIPPLFRTIQSVSETTWKEMYQVFNMGHRMELMGPPELLPVIKKIGESYQLKVRQIGYCQTSPDSANRLTIDSEVGHFDYE